MNPLVKLTEEQNRPFFSSFEKAEDKYITIWDLYKEKMPACVGVCGEKFGDGIDGPQGIYWIGEKPLIFFVGRENYEWMGCHGFDADGTMTHPVWFTFFKTQYMPGFWKRIYDMSYEIFEPTVGNWHDLLSRIAISNACKCYKPSQQWGLHAECNRIGYVFDEAKIVNAPINVFFTKTFGTLMNNPTFQGGIELDSSGIFKYAKDGQVYYEMNHPGRMSWDTLAVLIEDIKNELSKIS